MVKTFSSVFAVAFILSSCAQEPNIEIAHDQDVSTSDTTLSVQNDDPFTKPHQYGGWYCPDNFGFKPVDVKQLNTVSVVKGRMPQKWETQNGMALMYLDPIKFPEAKPLDIQLPALAMVETPYTPFKELAIVIQAFVAGKDTIVGYRFPSGGNGSDWYQNVQFLSPDEVSELDGTPFQYEEITINASKEDIWKAFTKTDLAKELGKQFNEKKLYQSEWSNDYNVNLEFKNGNEMGLGYVAEMWGCAYLHIDFVLDGKQSTYKMLVVPGEQEGESTLKFTASSFPKGSTGQSTDWKNWVRQLKKAAEK